MIEKYKDELKNYDALVEYREMASRKSDFERTELAKDKTGVMIDGLCAINPVNGKEIPIWVSDYVLMSYGTGAIMAVPEAGNPISDMNLTRGRLYGQPNQSTICVPI